MTQSRGFFNEFRSVYGLPPARGGPEIKSPERRSEGVVRVAVGGFALESASFLPEATGREVFEAAALRGPAMVEALRGSESAGGGFVDCLEAEGAAVAPLVYADAGAAGHAADAAFDAYCAELCAGLADLGGEIDGLLLFLHGAMTTPSRGDPEGELLHAIRAVVGPGLPVVVALDLHANLTAEMVALCNGAFGYHYSPHTDMAETGARAARCLLRALRGEIAPVTAIAKVPVVLPSIFTATALPPLSDLVAAGFALEREEERLLDLSLFCGFAYADVPQIGMSVVAVADGDPACAERAATDLAARVRGLRRELLHEDLVYGLEAGVARGLALAGRARRPVVLLEHADRMNDSTWVLRELLRRGATKVAVPYLWDPEAVRLAMAAGVGARVTLAVGGRSSARAGGPVEISGEVLYAGPKRYLGTGPMRRGRIVDLGSTALIDAGGILVSLTTTSLSAIDADPFVQFGLDPLDFDIIVLRSKTHFRAVYETLAEAIVIVDTPDWGPADLTALPYRNVRPGVYPITGPG
jgi:microcystin degradation protein MlrC